MPNDIIAQHLKTIRALALDIQKEAAHRAANATTGPVKRYYAQEFSQGVIASITSDMAGFERNLIARAESFGLRYNEGE